MISKIQNRIRELEAWLYWHPIAFGNRHWAVTEELELLEAKLADARTYEDHIQQMGS